MHMICNSTDAERLYFILLCDSAHERPKSLLDFAHQQRFAIFGAKNTVNIKRRKCISHGPNLISIVPPGRDHILNTSTGDKSPAYFLVVPPGHTGTATALTLKCPNSTGRCLQRPGAASSSPPRFSGISGIFRRNRRVPRPEPASLVRPR